MELDRCPSRFALAYLGRKRYFSIAFSSTAQRLLMVLAERTVLKRLMGLPPDFLCSLVASTHFMRLSLKKAAYAVISSAVYRKSGSPRHFRPRYAEANLGHPSITSTSSYVLNFSLSKRPGGGGGIPARRCDSYCDQRLAALRARASGLSRPREFAHTGCCAGP